MLLGLFQNIDGCVSDTPKMVYFFRIQHGCDNIFGEAEQHSCSGALLSYFLEPIYIFSMTIGQSNIASKTSIIEDEVMRAIHECILPLSNKLMDPFQVNKPLVFVAPIPPEEFQHSETALTTLTCGYSICWNNSGWHEVILGTTGRKQGTSAKGAMSPSIESSLCKCIKLLGFINTLLALQTRSMY